MIIDNKHYINAIKLHGHLLVLDGIYATICWTSDDCDGQVDLKLHLSVGQVILFPYFDHCLVHKRLVCELLKQFVPMHHRSDTNDFWTSFLQRSH